LRVKRTSQIRFLMSANDPKADILVMRYVAYGLKAFRNVSL